ncbi:MAG TPA: hypothetical protein DEB06_00030, partial [Phycisphaerales bacterium]|nr:hypothetical protein [Phycisphaerales bacterium]
GSGRAPSAEEVLGVIKELNPRLFERLERVRAADEEAFNGMLREASERVHQFVRERRENPDLFQSRVQAMRLERQAGEQARRAHAAAESDRPGAEAELRATVSRLFDQRAKVQASEIERLGTRLDDARKRFEVMVGNRERFIEQHTKELMDRAARGAEPEEPDGSTPRPGDGSPPR